jgi:hypothetical protein
MGERVRTVPVPSAASQCVWKNVRSMTSDNLYTRHALPSE